MERSELFEALINKCNLILEKHGKSYNRLNSLIVMDGSKPFLAFEDEVFRFVKDPNTQEIELTKKDNLNPVLCRDKDGKIYRSHGEIKYIQDHIIKFKI